jgi:hypothetical protein
MKLSKCAKTAGMGSISSTSYIDYGFNDGCIVNMFPFRILNDEKK